MVCSVLKLQSVISCFAQGKIPLIGCGGITSGEEAYLKIRAGATLVQLYTAFAYEGPLNAARGEELAGCLERGGFKSVQDAVGAVHHS
ncbi:unnamed protein product [Sphagnum jensenii]|uniref:Dihydroorotate dehydrogenase catalytic domain-containing protein n=1 Tax=Sphagnum jensenii TaxID=128206 RepID=A0ABP1AM06_9BRYO